MDQPLYALGKQIQWRFPERYGEDKEKKWKASEWYSWLLVYSLPCLNGILPHEYWMHFLLLVQASYLLLQKSISLEDLHQSDLLFIEFVGKCQILYGAGVMTFNIHSSTHLTKCAQLWGPLWTHSCFPFEAANFRIKRQLQGNTGFIMQALRKFLFVHMLPSFISRMEVSDPILHFFHMVSSVVSLHGYNDVRVLGNGHTRLLSATECEALEALTIQVDINQAVTVYNRIRVRGHFYCSSSYRADTMKRNNTLVAFNDEKVGKLESIVALDDSCFMMVYLLELENIDTFSDPNANVQINHIKICNREDVSLTAVPTTDVHANCVEMIIGNHRYISKLPNYVSLN
ncbi:uncharacterized protein [Diadema setosum]|uniref:uncharacterized protein n=1 Tax=Diadema setosum TaxID=31175 RepID=UPI003B3BADE9